MPLIIEGRVPSRWLDQRNASSVAAIDRERSTGASLNLALINNMPDAALEDTELQFFELLDIASGDLPVFIKLYSLTGVPRTERGERHLNAFYFDFNELWKNQFDGVIITGTEPHHPNLKDEPYWPFLTEVFDWAARNTHSTVLSCLAAHASVLYGDGVVRHRLPDKRFGVFESEVDSRHSLLGDSSVVHFPHSRWNEVRAEELTAAGYTILTKSREAGVDLFVKQKQQSLFVHFQGHPEYGAETLLREYRRDIKRFLRGERDSYPTMPYGYFNRQAAQALSDFQKAAIADRREEIIASFPEAAVNGLLNSWHPAAVLIYTNWLQYLIAAATKPAFMPVLTRGVDEGRRSAAS